MKKRRLFSLFLSFALLLPLFSLTSADAYEDFDLDAKAGLLIEADTGEILYEKNAHQENFPASLTKVMVALLVFEAIDEGKIALTDSVTATESAFEGLSSDGSTANIVPGETMTVEQLLNCMLIVSANEACNILGETLYGSVDAFVARMNERAKELGMNDTHFVNCTGLPAEGHVTSAWDIALMSRELILHHPDIRRFTTIWMDTLRGGSFQLSNTNKLIRFYDGATGLKTGSTDAAGFCISATAERDGMELIAVIMKGQTADKRNTDAKTLLNYGFSTYALAEIAPQEPLAPVPVRLGAEDAVQPVLPSGSTLLVEKTKAGQLTQSVELPAEVEAPVAAGQALGTLTVRAGDEVLLELPLQAEQAVEKLSWGGMLTRLLRCAFLAG